MDTIYAQPIHRRNRIYVIWRRFREWSSDSLVFYPFTFMVVAVLLVAIFRQLDTYITTQLDLSGWWMVKASVGVSITSLVASSVLSFLALVFSISLVALQLANQQYSPRVLNIFEHASSTKVTLSLFIATFVYSFILLIEILRTNAEEISNISLFTNVLLIFASVIMFVIFTKAIMLMMRVSYIISIVARHTRKAIDDNLPVEETYIRCQAVAMESPRQIIRYTRPSSKPLFKRYRHGVLTALEYGVLTRIASLHNCTLRILPRFGDYINEGDPIVEVYGHSDLPSDQVVKAFYIEPERIMKQDPAYGIRMLVDIALQALPPTSTSPTTAHQVILSLTSLLAMIAQRPEHSGAFADYDHQVRLVHPGTTWKEYVELAFSEIRHYGGADPQAHRSLLNAINYLLGVVPETLKLPLEHQKLLLSELKPAVIDGPQRENQS